MNFKLALFICCTVLFISPAFGQGGSGDGGFSNIGGLLNYLIVNVNNVFNSATGAAGDLQGQLNELSGWIEKLTEAVVNLYSSVDLSTLLSSLMNTITSDVNGFVDVGNKLLQTVQILLNTRAETGNLNAVLTQYRAQVNAAATYQAVLNAYSKNPLNGLLSVLGTNRYQLVTSMQGPIPMLCSLQADATADPDTRAIATAFLGDIRAAASEIKFGKCFGLACPLSLIPAAQQIVQLTNCA